MEMVVPCILLAYTRTSYHHNPFNTPVAGYLHGVLLLALILATMVICWRVGKRPVLAVSIVLASLLVCILVTNLLVFTSLQFLPVTHSLDSASIITFITHQVIVLCGCMLAILYAVPKTPRHVMRVLFISLVCLGLVGWHYTYLLHSDFRALGFETANAARAPFTCAHTWLTGLEWYPYHQLKLMYTSPQPGGK